MKNKSLKENDIIQLLIDGYKSDFSEITKKLPKKIVIKKYKRLLFIIINLLIN